MDDQTRPAGTRIAVTGVDCHVHVLRLDWPLAAGRHSRPGRDATVDDLAALLDGEGLSHAVATAPSFYGADNRLLFDALERGAGRVLGVMQAGPEHTGRLAAMTDRGVRGIRVNLMSDDAEHAALQDWQLRLVEEAAAAGLHVEVLVPPASLARLGSQVLERGATLVVDHFGLTADPHSQAGRFLMSVLPEGGTWVKLSGPYRLPRAAPVADWARTLVGTRPDRLVWGSDWPWVSHEARGFCYHQVLGWLGDWIEDADARRGILRDNPAVLYGLGGRSGERQ